MRSEFGEDVESLLRALDVTLPYKSFPVELGATVMPASAVAEEQGSSREETLSPPEPRPGAGPDGPLEPGRLGHAVIDEADLEMAGAHHASRFRGQAEWASIPARRPAVATLDAVPAVPAIATSSTPTSLSLVFKVLQSDAPAIALEAPNALHDQLHRL